MMHVDENRYKQFDVREMISSCKQELEVAYTLENSFLIIYFSDVDNFGIQIICITDQVLSFFIWIRQGVVSCTTYSDPPITQERMVCICTVYSNL